MRVTNRMMGKNIITNLTGSMEYLLKVQNQMSTGKQVSRPSDNPVATARILSLKSVSSDQDQYQRNMDSANEWVNASEGALSTVSSILNRARELVISGATGTSSQTERDILAAEMRGLLSSAQEQANSSHAGRYLFGGYATDQLPFSEAGGVVTYNGDSEVFSWEISPGVTVGVNTPGDQAFVASGVFSALESAITALESGDTASLSGATLTQLDDAAEEVLSLRATLGARGKRLEDAMAKQADSQIQVKALISKQEDVDLAQAIIDYQLRENAYQAALATASKVLLPSLVDFLT